MGYDPSMSVAAHLLLISVISFAPLTAQAKPSGQERVVRCGEDTDVATIERYFLDLREALAQSGPKARFNKFVGTAFGVRSKVGHTLYFNVKDVGSVTPGRISVEEWREIDQRGAASLHNAGWRGCFLDNGKVWFQANGDGRFALTLIARDMQWGSPTRGDVLP